jgi:hypothetical protein
MAAGPNSLCGSGPNPNLAFEHALTLPGSPELHYVDPRQFLWLSDSYAAGNNFGSLHSLAGAVEGSSRVSMPPVMPRMPSANTSLQRS